MLDVRFGPFHYRQVQILFKLLRKADNNWGRILPNGFCIIPNHQALGLTAAQHIAANRAAVTQFRAALGNNA